MELDLAGMHQLAAGQGIDPETLDAALGSIATGISENAARGEACSCGA